MPPEAAELTLRAVLAAASLAFCVLGVRALDRGPFSFSNADIAYLVTSRVDLGLVLLSGFAASLARALIVGAFAGVAFGVAAGAAGSSVSLVVFRRGLRVNVRIGCRRSLGDRGSPRPSRQP